MEMLTGLLIGCFVCYVIFVQIKEWNKLKITEYQFRFFALRDRLCMLVAFEGLPEKGWEYKQISSTLNYHIQTSERMSIMWIVRRLAEFHASDDEDKRVQIYTKKIEREDLRLLLVEFMQTSYELLSRNSRGQLFLIALYAKVFNRDRAMGEKKVFPNPAPALRAITSHKLALSAAPTGSFGSQRTAVAA